MGELRIKAPRTDYVTGVGGTPCSSSSGHVDIGSPEDGTFRLWGSGIESWWVENGTLCCPGCTTTDLKRSVKIYLYRQRNYEGYVGYVLFGHVESPQLSNGGRNYAPSGELIGYTPNDDCADGCYSGEHLHTEAEPASAVTLSVEVYSYQLLTAGSTTVYKWTY